MKEDDSSDLDAHGSSQNIIIDSDPGNTGLIHLNNNQLITSDT